MSENECQGCFNPYCGVEPEQESDWMVAGGAMIQISAPQIGKEEVAAVEAVLHSGRLAQGPRVAEFEQRFAEYVGAKHGVAVGNGTQALHLALLAHDVWPGSEVVTTPFSFMATVSAILMCQALPLFTDVEEDTGNIFEIYPDAFKPKGRCYFLPVHLYGHPCTTKAEYHPNVIFDACQAHGAAINGVPVGALGTSCWSFYATKNMTTGEGGMITTNDGAVDAHLRLLRNHGSPQRYEHLALGYNYRMTEMQAAIGLVQLDKLPAFQARRQYNAAYLTERLGEVEEAVLPTVREGCTHAWHQYTVRVPDCKRDSLAAYLRENGINAQVYYPIPLHKTRLLVELGYGDKSFPVAERLAQEVLSLPVHPGLTDDDLDAIVGAVKRWAAIERAAHYVDGGRC